MSEWIQLDQVSGCRLWIDGVGTWLVWFDRHISFGNAAPSGHDDRGRLRIYADLKTRHLTCVRRSDGDFAMPIGTVAKAASGWPGLERRQERNPGALSSGSAVLTGERRLRSGEQLVLGTDVVMRYTVPSPLSRSAVFHIESGHRFVEHADSIVWFEETCLLGPAEQSHVPCPQWQETVVLFSRDRQLWRRTHGSAGNPEPVLDGGVINGSHWRMRIESVK